MIETLEAIDRSIVLTINSWNTPFLDEFMWIVSEKITWIPLYLLFLYLFAKKFGVKKTIIFTLCGILVVVISDLTSVHLFKNVFERYRPSHNALLTDQLHFYQFENGEFYKGGQFGFISSHASNFVGICTYALFVLRSLYKFLLPLLVTCISLVLLSRIYLGVHYLSDVLVGAFVGVFSAFIVFRLIYNPMIKKPWLK